MPGLCSKFLNKIFGARFVLVAFALFFILPNSAHANWGIVDSLDVSPFVPIILDALMSVATATYGFFVGHGFGIIYVLIWGFLGFYIAMYLIKMFFPPNWLSFFGFSGGGEAYTGKDFTGMKIGENILKPILRAIIAATILLQVKPIYVTNWIVNPFLEFGSLYTEAIVDSINVGEVKTVQCPTEIIENDWISKDSCDFLIKPIAQITHENNKVVKRGFEFINNGLLGLMTIIPHGGRNFLNIITGLLLVTAFVSSNFFMALLIIQGIFSFGMALTLYPFKVLTYVVKPKNKDSWVDPWPAFEGIIGSLKELIITMIACAFILVVNIAIIKSLFNWNSSVFVVAAGGSASSNVPVASSAISFGEHSILWLSAILTIYLMFRIFDLTKKQITKYSGKGMDELYNNANKDFKTTTQKIQKFRQTVKDIFGKKTK